MIKYGKLNQYIKKCFEDAAKSENRQLHEHDYSAEYVVLDGIYLIPFFSCKYGRVLARVHYRIRNNLPRNFGLKYNLDDTGFEIYRTCVTEADKGDSEVWDQNAAIGLVRMESGKVYFIEDTVGLTPYSEHCPYKDIPEHEGFHGDTDHAIFWKQHKSFREYKDLYTRCYGTWPEHTLTGSDGVKAVEC